MLLWRWVKKLLVKKRVSTVIRYSWGASSVRIPFGYTLIHTHGLQDGQLIDILLVASSAPTTSSTSRRI